MRKGEATKQEIIRRVAPVFNRQGFAGSSLSDIMQATGLHKGGIYNHFDSKEQLALEAFDYAAELMRRRWKRAIERVEAAPEQLEALIEDFSRVCSSPEVEGGCPLLNTAIDSDDTNSLLRDRAREAFSAWHGQIAEIVRLGQQQGTIKGSVDAKSVAVVVISSLEGALMLSQLYKDEAPLQESAAHLMQYVRQELVA